MFSKTLTSHKGFFFKLFPPPHFLMMPSFGLNISDHSIRVLELIHGPKTKLGRFGSEPIPEGVIKNGTINNREALKEVLRSVKKKYDISFVRSSLPEEKAYSFKLQIPNSLDEDQIRSNIEFKLEDSVPLSVKESLFDYNIIPESSTKNHVGVGVSVLPQKVVADHTDLLHEAGLIPISFEVEAESIARAVIKEGDLGTYMIVDYGRTRTSFSVVSRGVVRYTSTADIGGELLEDIVKKNTGVSTEEVQKLKNEKGLVQDVEYPELYMSLANIVSVLKDEINKRYIFWHTHKEDDGEMKEKIQKIILVGGNSNLFGLDDYLSSGLKVKVERANVWSNISFDDDVIPPISFGDSLSYASAIGLSLIESI
jgi:type IV pilus assembly protein PilM